VGVFSGFFTELKLKSGYKTGTLGDVHFFTDTSCNFQLICSNIEQIQKSASQH
jgi:hypothetical protein